MKEKIIKILTELRPEFDFTEEVNFIEEGMLDSFDIVSLVDALDTEFNIVIDGVDIRGCTRYCADNGKCTAFKSQYLCKSL